MIKEKTKKKKDDGDASRETPVSFFTRKDVKEALEAEAGSQNRSRSRHIHVILAKHLGLPA